MCKISSVDIKTFLRETGMNLHQLAQRSEIAYSTLAKHVNAGHQLSVGTAKKRQAYDPRLNPADVLGLSSSPSAKAPRRERAASARAR